MEALVRVALGEVTAHDAAERVHDLFDRHRAGDPVAEGGVGPEAAAEADVDCLDDLVADVCRLSSEADVGDLRLGARSGAAGEVHPHDRRRRAARARRPAHRSPAANRRSIALRPLHGPRLGLDDREPAELAPGAGDDAPLEGCRERRVTSEQLLAEKRIDPVVRDAGEDEVLIGRETDLAVAVELRQAGHLDEVASGEAADGDRAADVGQAVLLLGCTPTWSPR